MNTRNKHLLGARAIQNEPWMSVAGIAAHLGVRPHTVYKWVDRRQLPAHKLGRLWKFQVSEVDEWVRAGRASGARRNRRAGHE